MPRQDPVGDLLRGLADVEPVTEATADAVRGEDEHVVIERAIREQNASGGGIDPNDIGEEDVRVLLFAVARI